MSINWQRLRLKLYHLIGRLTGNYYLENRLLLDIREWRAANVCGVVLRRMRRGKPVPPSVLSLLPYRMDGAQEKQLESLLGK